ncbi:hypothetical protein E3N88_32107 [Mikania micrantha]|uniref:Reverse transcriptase Ty1/copia-type domain-containing protein n=1 Tax=Mikania micrantha TaxID=192012 RepID=A0A5N6MA73_9ASTR|nr:hypothetical protein E3N88_32107 [Mikania micrantha]
MDVVTTYLYGTLDTNIYMKLPEGFKLPKSFHFISREHLSIKLNKSLYGLKQCGCTAISWHSVKQTITTTLSNHAEILAIHEASRECIWLRTVIQHIQGSCGISSQDEGPTILHQDNAACIAQLRVGYIKGDRTKHILPMFFFTHYLQKNCDIVVQQIRSIENLADLFTKSLTTSTFQKLVYGIEMRQLKDLNS